MDTQLCSGYFCCFWVFNKMKSWELIFFLPCLLSRTVAPSFLDGCDKVIENSTGKIKSCLPFTPNQREISLFESRRVHEAFFIEYLCLTADASGVYWNEIVCSKLREEIEGLNRCTKRQAQTHLCTSCEHESCLPEIRNEIKLQMKRQGNKEITSIFLAI